MAMRPCTRKTFQMVRVERGKGTPRTSALGAWCRNARSVRGPGTRRRGGGWLIAQSEDAFDTGTRRGRRGVWRAWERAWYSVGSVMVTRLKRASHFLTQLSDAPTAAARSAFVHSGCCCQRQGRAARRANQMASMIAESCDSCHTLVWCYICFVCANMPW